MRIQHNILAMNAYRNYNTNTSALAKNLEKLSSGYKINRAGDDAAGLAISEKMRAQIKGLEAAQKNVKDGTSLVKTAEGAMQEIQDMLGRMKYLATQSSNGTYDDDVDRKNLQDEVDQLRSEINRIADSANFNGIKLLDGSMDTNGTAKGAEIATNATVVQHETESVAADVAPSFKISLDGLRVEASATGTVTIKFKVGSATFEATANATATGAILRGSDFTFTGTGSKEIVSGVHFSIDANGNVTVATTGSNAFTKASAGDLSKVLNSDFTITASIDGGAQVTASGMKSVFTAKPEVITTGKVKNAGQVAQATFNLTADMLTDGATITIGSTAVKVDYSKNASQTANGTLGVKDLLKSDGTIDMTKINQIADAFTKANGNNTMFRVGHNYNGEITVTQLETHHNQTGVGQAKASQAMYTDDDVKKWITAEGKPGRSGSLQLQIGDTSDPFNQLKVSIKDMHTGTSGLNIDGVDITNPTDAAKAIQTIMNAINTVSSTRGNLGAIQNRLDHTANNLSVMVENITDAESTIRDTDVAEEMMSYTKNNILVQSAQAMLAQANAVPQGVLQLLQ